MLLRLAQDNSSVIVILTRMADTRVGLSMVPKVPRIQVLLELNQAESLLCRYVHECQLHVATQLFV